MAHYHANHTTRLEQRYKALNSCFTVPIFKKVWKKYVYPGLRGQDILDLHDYYDFHRNQNTILQRLRSDILNGNYTPSTPLTIRLEKKAGLTRRLCIPSAEDAIVLQALSEALYPHVKRKQPSPNAFFSRSHGFKPPEIEIDDAGEYFWFIRWKEFSKRRMSFASTFSTICITDIANYFDTIEFSQLRNILSSICSVDEVILDFLFMMLEAFCWTPDYLPFMGKGLPQVNFDAPRILSHAFLFEADKLLAKRTNEHFVRWVDDITIAADSEEEGKAILRDLDELLMTRGLRLNSGKTVILNATDAVQHLWRDENQYLTVFANRIRRLSASHSPLRPEALRLRARYRKFLTRDRKGYWDKVYKRYYSIFTTLHDTFLEKDTPYVLKNYPSIRESAFRYYTELGPSPVRARHLGDFLKSEHAIDDTSIFQPALVMVSWPVSSRSKLGKWFANLAQEIGRHRYTRKCWTYFLAALWLCAKYGTSDQLQDLIKNNVECWRLSGFLSRQIAAVTPRFPARSDTVRTLRDSFVHFGHLGAINVLTNLAELRAVTSIPSAMRLYLLHGSSPDPKYPLAKALIALSVLKSTTLPNRVRNDFRADLLNRVADPTYRRWFQHLP